MRVAVVNLTSGGLSGGYRKYLARLMPLLASDPRVSHLTVFVPVSAAGAIDSSIDVRTFAADGGSYRPAALTRDVAEVKPDVVFVPSARRLRVGNTPVVTMVRNMEPLLVPFGGNTLREGLRNEARAWEARRACRIATRVIAVSSYVREFVIARWHLDPARVGTAYHGVDRPAAAAEESRDPILFTAGSIRPARGLEDVIQALAQLDRGVRLVIAGRVDAGCERYGAMLRGLADRLGVSDRITWAGQLDDTQMAAAFGAATMFVMTSRAEACPNLALEAMSYGRPAVSVDRQPMPEIFGDAALYYPTGAASVLARQVGELLNDATRRRNMSRTAAERAAGFTWEATRERTLGELERALGDRRMKGPTR
jgi:glycosyltransferase involved in cell wall biosynthesis